MREGRRISIGLSLLIYSVASLLVFIVYRFFIAGSAIPLPPFTLSWRFATIAIDYIASFPALVLSALTLAFAFDAPDALSDDSFSPRFLDSMMRPLIAVGSAALVYGILFLLVQPMALNARTTMKTEGELFRKSAGLAMEEAEAGQWKEAARYLAACERIWPESPDNEKLRDLLDLNLEAVRRPQNKNNKKEMAGQDRIPKLSAERSLLSARDALIKAQEALREGGVYDAHWLAVLAGRLAKEGSPEFAESSLLASKAWNAIASLEPNKADMEAFSIYQRKREGYQALSASDYIRAYYIFEELSERTNKDPDIDRFLSMSEDGAKQLAFFVDEMSVAVGNVESNALFSLPRRAEDGHIVGRDLLRLGSLHIFADAAYADSVEMLSFAKDGQLLYSVQSRYGKFIPMAMGSSGEPGSQNYVALLFLALDREDEALRWAPEWSGKSRPDPIENRVLLDLSYEDFLLVSRARRGINTLSVPDLIQAEKLSDFGFIPEALHTEILRRFSEPFAFLSLGILTLAFAWRLRPKRRIGWVVYPSFIALPFVFNLLADSYRSIAAIAATNFIIALPFSLAILLAFGFQAVLLIASLIILAGQRG